MTQIEMTDKDWQVQIQRQLDRVNFYRSEMVGARVERDIFREALEAIAGKTYRTERACAERAQLALNSIKGMRREYF